MNISFISANFVARELGYTMTEGWMQGDGATQAHFAPIATFEARFRAMLSEIKAMGFAHLDLWGAHLHPDWASPEHLAAARVALQDHGLMVHSLAAWCGSLEHIKGFARVANGIGASVLAGGAPIVQTSRAEALAILRDTGIKIAFENHPEKSAAQILEQIGTDTDVLGAAPDTGWWATQGTSAPEALRQLKDHLLTVHLKDIKQAGAHDTCRFGDGVADIAGCVAVLKEIGYDGVVGIEHEPEHHNPTADILYSKQWLETKFSKGS
jgi:L-ribulose-5-phosphate 3-epimerase